MVKNRRWYLIVTKTASLIVMLMGTIVILGWVFKSKGTVQILPTLVPMQFNTALCFLMSGLSLFFYSKNRFISNAGSSLIFLICLMTLIEYLLYIDIGIDNLFIEPFISTKTSHPGRMAPNTALSFLFFSWFIFLNQIKSNKFWYIIAIFPCIYGILGSISLTGYLFNIEQAYAWGALTHMALHTSIAFVFLSGGSLSLFFYNRKLTIIQQEIIYDVSIFTFVLFFCFIIWLSLRANVVNNLQEEIDSYSSVLSSKLAVKLESEIEALIRIFARYNDNSYTNNRALRNDVNSYFKHMPFLKSLNFNRTKQDAHALYITLNGNRQNIYRISMGCKPSELESFGNETVTLKEIVLGKNNFLCIQIYGFTAVISLTELLDEYISNESNDFEISISETGKNKDNLISSSPDEEFTKFWTKVDVAQVYGKKYDVSVSPKKQYIKEHLGKFPFYALILSVFLSILILLIAKNKRQLVKKDQALKYSENLNFTILNTVGESIIGINQNYNVNFMNQSSQDLLRFSYDQNKKTAITDILKSDKDRNKQPATHYVKISIKKGKIVKHNVIYILTKKNKVIPVSLSISPIIDNDLTKGAIIVLFDIRERIQHEESLKEIAYFDSLTNIPNRYSLLTQIDSNIARAKTYDIPFALCFIDVNKFKSINDTYGHHVGDKALQYVAKKLKSSLRKNDFLGRLAGDEFCVILDGVDKAEQIDIIIKKLKTTFQEPFEYKNLSFLISISIGYVFYSEGLSAEELLTQADQQMYRNKAST